MLDAWHKDMITKHGFCVHYVKEESTFPYKVNIHTHGIEDHLGHPDLQIVLPVPPDVAAGLFAILYVKIKDGARFSDGQVLKTPEEEIKLPIKFVSAKEGGRDLLRIILPDVEGRTSYSEMSSKFRRQYLGRFQKVPEA
jgi:hypothetical protein